MPKAKLTWEAEKRDEEERRRPKQRSTGLLGSMDIPNFAVTAFNYHYVRDRVLWRTELGTPREHDKSFNLRSVGP